MPKFSIESKTTLASCDERLQRVFNEVIQHYDVKILWGYRGKSDQDVAYASGNSTKPWPQSKHNQHPSLAVDAVPYPIDWKDTKRFYYLIGLVDGIAKMMGIKIRSGGDWDMDTDFNDQGFNDLGHFEVV